MADRAKRLKRGRASSAEERWRDLAREVPGVLLRLAGSESEAILLCLESTDERLRSHTVAELLETCRAARLGNIAPPPRGRSIDTSHREVERLATLHDAAGRLFAYCAARLGLITAGGDGVHAETRAWLGRRAEAARIAAEAQRRLRYASAYFVAAFRFLFLLSGWPSGSPLRVPWAYGVVELLRKAVREAAAVRRMRHAVLLEFFHARRVLGSLDAEAAGQPT
ncbi:hypothetical protein QOZ80_1BG0058940 [Eleusine coracana subsp. coracana]|nr:hypothetical protein QOZ80_1BG0058940 [Eleusine coracana subsp. coracana]